MLRPYPPDRLALERAKRRRMVKRYAMVAALVLIVLAWVIGYAQGAFRGYQAGLVARIEETKT